MARAALILAALALGVSVVGALDRRPAAPSTAAPTPVDAEAAALRARVAALEARVAALGRAPAAPAVASAAPAPIARAAAPDDGSARRRAEQPVVVEVRAPHPAVTVTAQPDGALAVVNTDPALAGQVMTVQLRAAGGEVVERRITVPTAQ